MFCKQVITHNCNWYLAISLESGYSPPLTNLAAQTEFSQLQKDCSSSSKDGHGLKFEQLIVELIEMSVVKGKVFRASCCFIVEAHFCASDNFLCAV